MYKKILAPIEGSGFDREAIRVALRMGEKSGAELHLVRVANATAFGGMGGPDDLALSVEAFSSKRDGALGDLYALAAECRGIADCRIVTALEEGPVPDALVSYASRCEVDLIVISSHGRHGIARASLGSVTNSLIRHANVPVLVVKPSASYLNPRAAEQFSRIVVPLDGSTLAEQMLPEAVRLAKLEDAEVVLLNVVTGRKLEHPDGGIESSRWQRDLSQATAYLFSVAKVLREAGLPVRTDVVVGEDVAQSIIDYTSRSRANLIAIATHGRGSIARLMRGSVADELTRLASVSMLVLRPDTSDRNALLRGIEELEKFETV